jgi:hypothetical protein
MLNGPKHNVESRRAIISDIKTPLALLSLIVLSIEVVLIYLATQAEGWNLTLLIVGMILALLFFIAIVGFLFQKVPLFFEKNAIDSAANTLKYDVFLSSPMAAFKNDVEYKRNREYVLQIINTFQKECQYESVIFAGHKITSITDFEAPNISAADDIKALRNSKYFVLHYSEKIVSSVLFEAGVALALNKPSIYFVKNKRDLPFLMEQAEMAFSNVKIYECNSVDEILNIIKINRVKLFDLKTSIN